MKLDKMDHVKKGSTMDFIKQIIDFIMKIFGGLKLG